MLPQTLPKEIQGIVDQQEAIVASADKEINALKNAILQWEATKQAAVDKILSLQWATEAIKMAATVSIEEVK